jgi:hypothetical protein
MTKNQKIWFWVGVALFAIPEILWSPIVNIIYEFTQNSNKTVPLRNNFLMNPDNITLLNYVLFMQGVGVMILIVDLLMMKKNWKVWLVLALLMVFGVAVWFLFYLSVALGRHGIN